MIGFIATSAAVLAGSALASGVGSAVVVNNCAYDVHLCNVPSSGGGYSEIDRLLQTGEMYEQQWTQLSNTMGWSIKLSKDASLTNIMQYEYTYHGNDIIWYDLSEVNGNPWDGNFEITASSSTGCTPRQVAYRYSTDDAYGMQDCPSDSVITVTLCSGDNGTIPDAPSSGSSSGSSSSSTSSSASAYSAAPSPASSSYAASTFATSVVVESSSVQASYVAPASIETPSVVESSAAPTTASPSPTAAPSSDEFLGLNGFGGFELVTETAYVTVDTTMTAYPTGHPHGSRRHEHHARQRVN